MERLVLFNFILLQLPNFIFGLEINITGLTANGSKFDVNKTEALRYGHHRTQACPEFEKAYVCIMSCLQRGFDIAESDRHCTCNCYQDETKKKYFDKVVTWSIPTTSKPAWAAVKPMKGLMDLGEYVYYMEGEGPEYADIKDNDSDDAETTTVSEDDDSSKEHSSHESGSHEKTSKEAGTDEEHKSGEEGEEAEAAKGEGNPEETQEEPGPEAK